MCHFFQAYPIQVAVRYDQLFEIASAAIFGQKQSNFWLSMLYAFAKPADFEFPRETVRTKVGRTAGGWDDITRRTTSSA